MYISASREKWPTTVLRAYSARKHWCPVEGLEETSIVLKHLRKFLLRSMEPADYGRIVLDCEERLKLRKAGLRVTPDQRGGMKAFYRISDGSHKAERFQFATKETCLKNFLAVFQPPRDDLLIIADNVGEATWKMVNDLHPNTVRTDFRHGAGSWRYAAFDIALRKLADDDAVYFVEDDYLHLPGSRQLLLEGIAVADYVSLYDHRDKYLSVDEGGVNPFIDDGGEITRVIRTRSVHWKLTNSTTMTFATTVGALREDAAVWDRYTQGSHPYDFPAFLELTRKGRSLITPIPGYSTHCEPRWAAPGVDWEKVSRDFV